jgi:DNA-directed RNA polymerase specialized sigma24 family protein
MDERDLVKASKKGDDGALAALFQGSYPFLLKYLLKLTFNLENAEDLAQEKHYYGFSYEEIARIVKVPEGTVKSRVHKGIKTVRKELNQVNEEPSNLSKPLRQ